jgi:hypothetical protein
MPTTTAITTNGPSRKGFGIKGDWSIQTSLLKDIGSQSDAVTFRAKTRCARDDQRLASALDSGSFESPIEYDLLSRRLRIRIQLIQELYDVRSQKKYPGRLNRHGRRWAQAACARATTPQSTLVLAVQDGLVAEPASRARDRPETGHGKPHPDAAQAE